MNIQEIEKRVSMTDEEKLLEKIDCVIGSTCEKIQSVLSSEDHIIPSEAMKALANLINSRASLVINKNQ